MIPELLPDLPPLLFCLGVLLATVAAAVRFGASSRGDLDPRPFRRPNWW